MLQLSRINANPLKIIHVLICCSSEISVVQLDCQSDLFHTLILDHSLYIIISNILCIMYILLCSCLFEIVTFKGHFFPLSPGILNTVQNKWNKTVAYSCRRFHSTQRSSFEIKDEKILPSQQNTQCTSLFLVKYLRSAYEDGLKPC